MTTLPLFAAVLALSAGAVAAEHPGKVPVLLELFTSEGCSSCPPADRLLEEFDQRQPVNGADLIVLSEHVDYWNRLGWKDPFSSSFYSERQQEYAGKLRGDGVFTPQLVVDGRFGLIGSDRGEASAAIQKALRERKIPIAISGASRNGNQITAHIEVPAAGDLKDLRGILYLALADNRAESHVIHGENSGRFLGHVAVTRVLQRVGAIDLGTAVARDVTLTAQSAMPAGGSRLVAFVQDAKTGRVLAVTVRQL